MKEHGRVVGAEEAFENGVESDGTRSWCWRYVFRVRVHDADTLGYWRGVRRAREAVARELHRGFMGQV